MDNLNRLTTPEEYINYYYDQLKLEANKKNLQISKVGFLGYLLQIFGFTQYDTKTYYDYILNESSPATANTYESQLMHASVYGYDVNLATASTLVGNFNFNLNILPTIGNNVIKREIFINDLETTVDFLPYVLDSSYTMSINIDSTTQTKSYTTEIVDKTGKVTTVPFLLTNPTVPIIDLNQYSEQINTYTTGIYTYGTHYTSLIELESNGFVSEIKVYVLEDGATEYKEYDVEQVKYYSTDTDETVFITYLPDNKILLELGSGIRGKYIPNSQIEVRLKITQGEAGNIATQSIKPTKGSIIVYDTYSDNSTSNGATYDIKNFITINVDYGQSGTDPLDTDQLRSAIISYIRSRDNLISKQDFSDILDRYVSDFLILFKKANIFDNVFYLYVPFNDKYLIPIESLSYSFLESTFNPTSAESLYYPTFTINSKEFVSPFLYIKDDFYNTYNTYMIRENYSAYFNDIATEEDIDIIPIPLSVNITYDNTLSRSTIRVESYKNIDDYTFYLSIPQLNLNDIVMTDFDESTKLYYYTNNDGVIYDTITVTIEVYYGVDKYFTYELQDVELTVDFSEIIELKKYIDTLNDEYVICVPLILNSTFVSDQTYYINKFIATLSLFNIEENRMISDDVQARFINTSFVSSNIVEKITKQGYTHNIALPLKISFDLLGNSDYVTDNSILMSTAIRTFKITVATELKDNYTGTQIKFYKTKMHDFAYDNLAWLKDVTITITDSDDTVIANGNIETIAQEDLLQYLTKLETATYSPMLWHWDINNIDVTYTLE
jgi:hypothetical protein